MSIENDIAERRLDAIAELEDALVGQESGEGLAGFVSGHGIQSLVFAFEWEDPAVSIHFDLPYARVLSGEETVAEDDANIAAAIRVAILVLTVADKIAEKGSLSVTFDDMGPSYRFTSADGTLEDFSDGWNGLLQVISKFLDGAASDMTIFYP